MSASKFMKIEDLLVTWVQHEEPDTVSAVLVRKCFSGRKRRRGGSQKRKWEVAKFDPVTKKFYCYQVERDGSHSLAQATFDSFEELRAWWVKEYQYKAPDHLIYSPEFSLLRGSTTHSCVGVNSRYKRCSDASHGTWYTKPQIVQLVGFQEGQERAASSPRPVGPPEENLYNALCFADAVKDRMLDRFIQLMWQHLSKEELMALLQGRSVLPEPPVPVPPPVGTVLAAWKQVIETGSQAEQLTQPPSLAEIEALDTFDSAPCPSLQLYVLHQQRLHYPGVYARAQLCQRVGVARVDQLLDLADIYPMFFRYSCLDILLERQDELDKYLAVYPNKATFWMNQPFPDSTLDSVCDSTPDSTSPSLHYSSDSVSIKLEYGPDGSDESDADYLPDSDTDTDDDSDTDHQLAAATARLRQVEMIDLTADSDEDDEWWH